MNALIDEYFNSGDIQEASTTLQVDMLSRIPQYAETARVSKRITRVAEPEITHGFPCCVTLRI